MMRAKINFFGTEVGEHQNILLFIGAVVDNNSSKLLRNNFEKNENNNVKIILSEHEPSYYKTGLKRIKGIKGFLLFSHSGAIYDPGILSKGSVTRLANATE